LGVLKGITQAQPEKILELFIMYVLKYKQQIDSGDEDFFMANSFKSETEDDSDMLQKIFEFKNIWKSLNVQNKKIVKQYMQYLCELALQHVENVYSARK